MDRIPYLTEGGTMGRKEHPFVWYYNKNLHFAELINGWLFRGRDRLTADDISDSDRRILTRKGRNRYKDRFRDLCKSTRRGLSGC